MLANDEAGEAAAEKFRTSEESTRETRTNEAAPPPYDPVLPAPPCVTPCVALTAAPTGPRVNFFSVSKREGPISGTWLIDSRLQVPEVLLAPLERHNLSLRTKDGNLSANIALLSPGPERVSVYLDTKDGNINLALISRHNDQPFKARLKTRDGSIHIEIPRSFNGPIKHSERCEFSKEIQPNLLSCSGGNSFVGPLEKSGFKNFETWNGDQIDAVASGGKVKIKYYGEVNPRKRCCLWF